MRKITHNLLQHETTLKRSIKTKRLKAGWDEAYLLKGLKAKPYVTWFYNAFALDGYQLPNTMLAEPDTFGSEV
ncbi:MAG: hypothetical protein M3X11_24825 [Acidobacteriota bacterium]|nr:hypothetical protein [Acidobacteriota bacterium]